MTDITFRTDANLAELAPEDRDRALDAAARVTLTGLQVFLGAGIDLSAYRAMLESVFHAAHPGLEGVHSTDALAEGDRELVLECAAEMAVAGLLVLVGKEHTVETFHRLAGALYGVAFPEIEPEEWQKAAASTARNLARIEALSAEAMENSRRAREALRKGASLLRYYQGLADTRASRRRA